MLLEDLKALYLRGIADVQRELDLYPDEPSLWQTLPGLPNSAGNIILHLAGGLQYLFGSTLGQTGYIRDREAEFSRRDVPRGELTKELDAARAAVLAGFTKLTPAGLEQPFPTRISDDAEFSTRLTLLQLLSHLSYHLGQIDYHRRAVTGNSISANAVSATPLAKR